MLALLPVAMGSRLVAMGACVVRERARATNTTFSLSGWRKSA